MDLRFGSEPSEVSEVIPIAFKFLEGNLTKLGDDEGDFIVQCINALLV